MRTDVPFADYLTSLNEDILIQTEDLLNTRNSLEDLAVHCLNSYDKSLEQTVNYTAQALGSVAYKINQLATNFLDVLDHELARLNSVHTKVNHLNMQVLIHQERTARLLVGRCVLPRERLPKDTEPILEISGRYQKKEIDFSVLDHIGHGTKLCTLGEAQTSPSRCSSVSAGSTAFETNSSTQLRSPSTTNSSASQRRGSDLLKYGRGTGLGQGPGLSPTNIKCQIPMTSPSLNKALNIPPPGNTPNHGTAANHRQVPRPYLRSMSVATIQVQQKLCDAPDNIPSSQKVSTIPPPTLEPSLDKVNSSLSAIPGPPNQSVMSMFNFSAKNDPEPALAHSQTNRNTSNEPSWAPNQYLCKVVTLYEYHQNKFDELSFQEQEIIYVVKKNSDGWWEGILRDRKGLFPGNYGTVID